MHTTSPVGRLHAGHPAAARATGPARHGRAVLPPLNAAVPSTSASAVPVTRDEMIEYLRSGCKPRSAWKLGTEHEKLGFYLKDHRRIDYDTINKIFTGLQTRYGWQPIVEGGNVICLLQGGQSITLEPGGQFELSGAVLTDLHATVAETSSHLSQLKAVASELGVGFTGLGFDPKWRLDEIPMMPKGRYQLMKAYMPTVGSRGLDMMFRTCTTQVNLDYESEADMVEKFRIGLALQPLANALFANSPFREGKPSGFTSTRGWVWEDVDGSRCGNLPFVFQPGMGFERYTEYAMDVPMYFVYRDGRYVNALGQSWRDFMAGKLPALPGERPTLSDWANHLTTLFPEVRLKKFLEMRGADCGPLPMIIALPALWTGLLYDRQAQAECAALIADWTQAERDALRADCPRHGLRATFRGRPVKDVAQTVVGIAAAGLKRRGMGEESLLAPLQEIADSGLTLADRHLESFHGRWGGSVDPLYTETMY